MPDIADPTLDQLRVLLAVAETGSFSAAARRLRRAQSVVSYTIANLELELGLALFDRAGRVPVLTEAGRAVVADACRVGLLVDALRARALALRQGTEAELGLAVDVMFPIPALVAALRDFAAAFPTVALRLSMEALGGVAQAVMDGCALGVSGFAGAGGAGLARRAAGAIELVPVAAPDHPLAAAARITGVMAREHVQLVLSDRSRLTEGQTFGVLSPRTWRLGDLGAKHALLRAGLGWGNMPLHMVEEDFASGALARLAIEEAPVHLYPFSLLTASDRAPGPAAAWLAERLVAALPGPRSVAGGLDAPPHL